MSRQASIKFTNEPPQGIKAGIKRTYAGITQDFLDISNMFQWKPMLYGVSFLHTVVQVRNIVDFADSFRNHKQSVTLHCVHSVHTQCLRLHLQLRLHLRLNGYCSDFYGAIHIKLRQTSKQAIAMADTGFCQNNQHCSV